jgi:hypothetical protein
MGIEMGTKPGSGYAEQVEYITPLEEVGPMAASRQVFTAIAVFAQGQWTAVCWELDIAAQSDTRDDAVRQLAAAVRAALDWASEAAGRVPGEPVPEGAMVELFRSHDARAVNSGVFATQIRI